MDEKVTRINTKNCNSRLLDVGNDFVGDDQEDYSGEHVGTLTQLERVVEDTGVSYRMWFKIPINGDEVAVPKFLPTARRFQEELLKFEMDLDKVDTSKGLDCSSLIGRRAKLRVESRTTQKGELYNYVTDVTPILV